MLQDRSERGTKRVCSECGTRFYDLTHVPPTCPKCSTEYVVVARPPRAPRPKAKSRPAIKQRPARTWDAQEPKPLDGDDVDADDDADATDEE